MEKSHEYKTRNGTILATFLYDITCKGQIMMSHKVSQLELLRGKRSFNRINLQISWAHLKSGSLKFERLRSNYGDSRTDYLTEKRKLLSEGIKI